MHIKEIEINMARLYLHKKGFWLAILEITNHETGGSWSLLSLGTTEDGSLQLCVSGR